MMASISYRYICLFRSSILVSPVTHQSKLFCVITYSANLDRISVKQRTTKHIHLRNIAASNAESTVILHYCYNERAA